MIVDIDRLPEEGLKISKDFEIQDGDLVEENAVFLSPLHAELSVKKEGGEVCIKGKIRAFLSCVCSRCLTPFEFPVDSSFDLVCLPGEWAEAKEQKAKEQLENEDMNSLFYYSRNIDLKEIVLEQLNLTLPMKPLCSEDCQGICPICGRVIKDGECSCMTNDSDPRLKKLKIFMKDKI